jgi:hypothetical protein
MRFVFTFILIYVFSNTVLAADVRKSTQNVVATTCGSSSEAKETVKRLSSELSLLRQNIQNLDNKQSSAMSVKDEELRKQNLWSDEQEESFFKRLVSSNPFQNFERERNDLVTAYMQATESTINFLANNEIEKACSSSSFMKEELKALYKITENQWSYMLAEKTKVLSQGIK